MMEKPENETDDSVYSNFDHELDQAVADELANAPGKLCAQHAAWEFCGYVWRLPDGRWVDQVWRYKVPVSDFVADSIEDVIELANDEFGYE